MSEILFVFHDDGDCVWQIGLLLCRQEDELSDNEVPWSIVRKPAKKTEKGIVVYVAFVQWCPIVIVAFIFRSLCR